MTILYNFVKIVNRGRILLNRYGEVPPFPIPLLKIFVLQKYLEVKTMAHCETCKNVKNEPENVPYIVYESSMARMERQIKRLWITVLVLIVMLVATNGAWLWY